MSNTDVFLHPLSDVQSVHIGPGTKVWQFCVILEGAVLGRNCNVCANSLIENDVQVGNNVTIKSGVQLWDGVRVGDDVFIGPNVTFTNDLVPRSKRYPGSFSRTMLEKGCSIGANSTLVAGIMIGAYAFVGAGSVVTHSVPAYTVWYGNPARQRGYVTREGILLDMDKKDKSGKEYRIETE